MLVQRYWGGVRIGDDVWIGANCVVTKDIDFNDDGTPKKPKPKGSGAAGGVTVIQNIYANTTDYVKQQKEAARQFRMIARTV